MARFRLITAIAASCGALLTAAAPAAAQVPNIGFVYPAGGQLGTSGTLTIGGGNLQEAKQVLVSGSGVTATIAMGNDGAKVPVELSINQDAAPGMREVRVVTARGTSNAGRIWIGPFNEQTEAEPNNLVSAAQSVASLPITINGQAGGNEDIDCFKFQAAAGETYVFDLVAARMASPLDGYLLLTDARGKHLAYAADAFERDPRIIYTFKESGTYSIQVRDSMFRGGSNFVYKLTAGKLPAVTGYFPLAGKKGQTVNVSVEGVNLGDMKGMSVAIPASGESVTVVPVTKGGPAAAPLTLLATDMDEQVEREPNNAADQATALSGTPVAVSGRMDAAGDVDVYRIKPAAAGTLVFDLQGRRLGSRIDSDVRILDVMGKELGRNQDAVGKDSRLALGVQANTEYLVEVKAEDRSFGPQAFYRLEIAPSGAPDFSLTVTPDEINVAQGNHTTVTVTATRLNGYAGPIALKLDGAPEGVALTGAAIQAGQNAVTFTVSAPSGLAPGTMNVIRVVGSASINNQQVERVAQPIETYNRPLTDANQLSQRPAQIFPLTVIPQQAFALDLPAKTITVKKGTQNVEVKVTSTRQMGQNGAITIEVAGQPANVAPAPTPIPQDKNETVVKFNVAANAPVGTFNIILTGKIGNNAQVAPAFTLVITE